MNLSSSLKDKLLSEKDKVSNSKSNSVIRTRFSKVKNDKIGNGILSNKSFLIKDNIAIKNEELTCCSNILKGYISPYSATVIDKIIENGGLITGQTNCDEFAMGSSSEYSIFGPVKNPHNEKLVAGGSSGGSAAAVAENLSDISLGSDTGGSVRQPAAFCGIYGFKPTYGRISRYGLVSHASSFDTIGIMSKKLDDIIKTFYVVSGKDPKDSTSVDHKRESLKNLSKKSLPKTVVVIKDDILNSIDVEIKDRYLFLVSNLKESGVKIKEIDLPFFKHVIPTYYVLTMAEASSNLSRYDGIRYGNRSSSKDLNQMYVETRSKGFSDEVKRRIMTGTYVLSSGYYDAYFSKALKVRRLIKKSYNQLFKSTDSILLPSTPELPFKIEDRSKDPMKMYFADIFTVTSNLVGNPALNIPCGFSKKDLPIGLQVISNSFNEETLFNFAHSLKEGNIFD